MARRVQTCGAVQNTRFRKLLRAYLIINTLIGVIGLAVGYYVANTDSGRQWFGRTLTQAASDGIPGSMTLGSVDHLGVMPLSATVRDLRILDPNGMTVLHARDATLVVDPLALLLKRVHVERADVKGGQILIAVQADGRTSLEAALAEPTPPEEKNEPPSGTEMRFDKIHVKDYVLELKPSKDERIRLRVGEGTVVIKTPPTVVELVNIRGRVQEPVIAGSNIEITNSDGWVHGGEPHVLELTLQSKLGDGRLDARLSFFNRDKTPLVARVHAHAGLKPELTALVAYAKSLGDDAVEFHFDEKVTAQARKD